MKKLTYVSSLIAFTIVILPIRAHSTAIPERGPIPFSAYDKDGDGLISENEFNEVRAERMSKRSAKNRPRRGMGVANARFFAEFDTDKNGTLTPDELSEGQTIQMDKRRSSGMGQNPNINKGMARGRNMPNFSEFDLNGDGEILEKEFNKARNKRVLERSKQGYRLHYLGSAAVFAELDVNGDGKISAEEFTTHQSQYRQQ